MGPEGTAAKRSKYRKPNIRPDARLFDKHPKGEIAGIVCMAVGYSSMGIFALILAGHLLTHLLYGGAMAPLLISGVIFLLGLLIGSYGSRLKGRTNRYRVYVDMVKEKLYCSIQDMASRTGRSERYIRRDLKKMMRLGMFKQAHLDQKETCLIASNEMYEQYKRTQKHYEESLQNEKQADAKAGQKDEAYKIKNSEVENVIEEGRGYIRCHGRIHPAIRQRLPTKGREFSLQFLSGRLRRLLTHLCSSLWQGRRLWWQRHDWSSYGVSRLSLRGR